MILCSYDITVSDPVNGQKELFFSKGPVWYSRQRNFIMQRSLNVIKKWNAPAVVIAALDLVIVVLEIIGFVINFPFERFRMVRFYTQDSNFFTMAACLIQLIYLLPRLRKQGPIAFPRWITVLKFISAGTLFITFLIVITVLAPADCIQKYHSLFGYYNMCIYGSRLYHHTICPILTVLGFLLLDDPAVLKRSDSFYILGYTLIYGIILILLNYFYIVRGPYAFLHVHEQAWYLTVLWGIVLMGIAYGTGCLMLAGNRKLSLPFRASKA